MSANRNFADADSDDELEIRVPERQPIEEPKKSRITSILKESRGLKDGAVEALKRPMTGLFRRTGKVKKGTPEEIPPSSVEPPAVYKSNIATALETVALDSDDSPRRKNANSPPDDKNQDYSRMVSNFETMSLTAPINPNLNKLDDIDLTVLTTFFYPEEDLIEEDEAWTWDYLFTTVSAELREDWLAQIQEQLQPLSQQDLMFHPE